MSSADELDPWEQLPTESSRAYAVFREFRDLGPTRTLRQVSAKLGTARDWSLRHRWQERARAWDAEGYRLEDARRLDAIRAMDEQHRTAARALIGAGLRALTELGPLTAHQAARFVDLGTRLERSALLGEHLPPPPASELDGDEELSPLERIVARACRSARAAAAPKWTARELGRPTLGAARTSSPPPGPMSGLAAPRRRCRPGDQPTNSSPPLPHGRHLRRPAEREDAPRRDPGGDGALPAEAHRRLHGAGPEHGSPPVGEAL